MTDERECLLSIERMPRDRAIDVLEHRGERSYDEQDVSVIIHPNGTSMYCGDRGLCVSLTKAVLEMTERNET